MSRDVLGDSGAAGGSDSSIIPFRPEDYGAARDSKSFAAASMALNGFTATITDGAFSTSDVGKTIVIYGAGLVSHQSVLQSTIASVQSPTQITLADAALQAVTNVDGAYGTDDTVAIQAAIDAAVADCVSGANAGINVCEVLFSAGEYMCSRMPVTGGANLANSQIVLPLITGSAQKVILRLRGAGAATFAHWNQTKTFRIGTTIRTTLAGWQTSGPLNTGVPPGVIGGPSTSPATDKFSNMLVVIDGLGVLAPRNPTILGINLKWVGQAHIKSLSVQADGPPSVLNTITPQFDTSEGLVLPSFGNNDYEQVESYACSGFYYGIQFGDHLTAERLVFLYCTVATISHQIGNGTQHGIIIDNLSVESCATVIQALGGAGGSLPIFIGAVHGEVARAGTLYIDTNNCLHGVIYHAYVQNGNPTVNGCANVAIYNVHQARGAVTAPGIPATTVALTNPFYRDASVVVTGGTVTSISVDGVTTGLTSGTVAVPTGKTITLAYSVAPTWQWTLV